MLFMSRKVHGSEGHRPVPEDLKMRRFSIVAARDEVVRVIYVITFLPTDFKAQRTCSR